MVDGSYLILFQEVAEHFFNVVFFFFGGGVFTDKCRYLLHINDSKIYKGNNLNIPECHFNLGLLSVPLWRHLH